MKHCTYEKLQRAPPEKAQNLESTIWVLAVQSLKFKIKCRGVKS